MHPIHHLLGDPTPFLDRLFAALEEEAIDVSTCELDHLCYRVESIQRYQELKASLSEMGELLSEKEIGGRPIAAFKLKDPLQYKSRRIWCLEIPAPKAGSFYPEGYEHAEFVIRQCFPDFIGQYPAANFDTKALIKRVNPEVRLQFEGFSVKFHRQSLEYVIRYLE
ncbi:MAG: VOC family protein [Phaeodactylibacter sp.]|nr:VOC family protein [Phaeodactylibacter sp.]MCB9050025.1 VOC family protein [Lewinellaceae bacterium]